MTKRRRLEKVVRDSNGEIVPEELKNEIKPEFWDEPIFDVFFEIYQRGKEFYQTLYYYQKIMGFVFNGEETYILLTLWNHVNSYYDDRDKKKRSKNKQKPKSKNPFKRR